MTSRRERRLAALAALLTLACVSVIARAQSGGGAGQAASAPASLGSKDFADRTAADGSFGPGVFLEDITTTIRLADFRHMTVSRTNSNLAYVGSWHGYVFRTLDGGKTWEESRLITERLRFFADKGQEIYFGVHRAGDEAWSDLHRTGRVMHADRTTRGGQEIRMREKALGFETIDVTGVGRISEGANRQFGIGLPGTAPRLQNVVRRFGKPTAGLNMKQMLLLRGIVPTEVRAVVISPHDPNVVFACTFYGLFMSVDGGLNWVRTFLGESPRARMAFHVAVDPSNDQKVFLATGAGMFISEDGGRNFSKAPQQGVGEGTINWIHFNPHDPRYVFVGIDYGLLRSSDGGNSWEWIYFTTFPWARVVRYIDIDPHDKKKGYIATHDGLFYTDNIFTASLEDWKRLGGLAFTGYEMKKVSANPAKPGHLWAMSNMKVESTNAFGRFETGGSFVWESVDGGINWYVIFSGNTHGFVEWYEEDPDHPELLWLLWTRSLSRLRRDPSVGSANRGAAGAERLRVSAEVARKVRRILNADEIPTIGEMTFAMWRYNGVEPGRQLAYRRLSRIKVLLPRIDLSVVGLYAQDYSVLQDGIYAPVLPFRTRDPPKLVHHHFRFMFLWNLAPLAFNLESVLFGRVDRVNGEVRDYLWRAVHRMYGEYRRLNAQLQVNPPRELYVRLHYMLRMEELESYIDFMSGGYLSKYKKGGKPKGMDEKWMGIWEEG